MKGQIMLRFSK